MKLETSIEFTAEEQKQSRILIQVGKELRTKRPDGLDELEAQIWESYQKNLRLKVWNRPGPELREADTELVALYDKQRKLLRTVSRERGVVQKKLIDLLDPIIHRCVFAIEIGLKRIKAHSDRGGVNRDSKALTRILENYRGEIYTLSGSSVEAIQDAWNRMVKEIGPLDFTYPEIID